MGRAIIGLMLLVTLWGTGCADPGSVYAMQQRVIRDAEPDQVMAAAAAVLQREFGRVSVMEGQRRIETAPREFVTERESGTARDLYRGRTVMRRQATFSVGKGRGGTVARLRINVERQDTERQVVHHPRGYRLSDNPGQETPIDRDAATTHKQNTIWTLVRRDRSLERALLKELQERFAPREPEASPAPDSKATSTKATEND